MYADDGYSGLNFNRPEFNRLLTDIDDLVITKDLETWIKLIKNYTEIHALNSSILSGCVGTVLISAITSNGKVIAYTYNSLDELIREDSQVLNKTVVYYYDAGGNILSKTEYPYTTGSTLYTVINTIPYIYGDSIWKDKLTEYNGKAITYEAVGNTLTYNGYTFTWEA